MYKSYKEHLYKLKDTALYRKLPAVCSALQNSFLDFSTNDYLCLSNSSKLLKAAMEAAKQYGIGSTGSRLLSGNKEIFEQLETRIAIDKREETALIFNSGFQANISVLAALLNTDVLKAKPLVFFDKSNHASLYQAVFLSGAELVRYRHNDMDNLLSLLKKFQCDNRPKFIVTETIFGMDGDILPINEVTSLATQYNAFLYLDEAHATGILGNSGYGLSTTIDLKHIDHIVMGTFSKALGTSGGYVACAKTLKEYLINKAQGFIYSTANSPMIIGAAAEAWKLVSTLDKERISLFALSKYLRTVLTDSGFNTGPSASHIISIILGREEISMKVRDILLENGIIVSCIRPPTVSPGTSRIRIALNISHTQKDINKLVKVLMTV